MTLDLCPANKASDAVVFVARTISVDPASLISFLSGSPVFLRAGRWPQSVAVAQDGSDRIFIRLKPKAWLQTDLERVLLLALRLSFQAQSMRCCQILLDTLLARPASRAGLWSAKKRALAALSVDDASSAHAALSQGVLKISNSKINARRQHLMALSESGDIRSLAELFSSTPLVSLFKSLDHGRAAHLRLIPSCLHHALCKNTPLQSVQSRSLLSHGPLLPRQEAALHHSLNLLASKKYGLRAIEDFLASVQNGSLSGSICQDALAFLEALALSSQAPTPKKSSNAPIEKAL